MAAKDFMARVSHFKMITPTVFELFFETIPAFEFKGGQFVSCVIPGAGPNGRDLRRAYSIASSPEKYPVELCIKIVEDGPGTSYLKALRPGSEFKIYAPYGDFVFKPNPGKNACFISTGTGIAPFRSMIFSKHFQENLPPRSWCLFGARHEDEILYENEIEKAGNQVQWVAAVSQPAATYRGFKGRVTDWLRSQAHQFPWLNTEYYLCGGGAMITEVKAILAEHGVTKEAIHQEVYYKS